MSRVGRGFALDTYSSLLPQPRRWMRQFQFYKLPATDENYSRAGSSLVALRKKTGVPETAILREAVNLHQPGVALKLPDAFGLAAAGLAAEQPRTPRPTSRRRATLRAMTRLSKAAQDEIVVNLAVDGPNLTEDEFDELYNQLDADHKREVRHNTREFVDNAVGSEHWDSDR